VNGAVECAIAATVEPVPDGLTAAGRDRVGATEGGERGLVAAPARVGEAHDGLGGADGPDPVPAGQTGSDVINDGQQLGTILRQLTPDLAQREGETTNFGLPHDLIATGTSGGFALGQSGKHGLGQGAAGDLAVDVVPGQQ
jgi:hypothetical protein